MKLLIHISSSANHLIITSLLMCWSFFGLAQDCPTENAEVMSDGTFTGPNCTLEFGNSTTITGAVIWNGGTMNLRDMDNGGLIIANGGSLTINSGTFTLNDNDGGGGNNDSFIVVETGGTLTVASGILNIEQDLDINGGSVVIQAGAVVNTTSGGDIDIASGILTIAGTLNSDDNMSVSGGTVTVSSGGALNTDDNITVSGGTLTVESGGNLGTGVDGGTGNFTVDGGNVILNGTATIDGDGVINNTSPDGGLNGSGILNVTGTFADNENVPGTFDSCTGGGSCTSSSFTCDTNTICTNTCPSDEADLADGGVFCGTCTLDVGGSITITEDVCWVNGTLQIDGDGGETEFTLNAGATLNIVSGLVHIDDGGADILGDIVIMDGAEFRQSANNNIRVNGGTITVESGGLLDVQDDFLVYNGAVFTIDFGGVANIGDDLRNSANGNSGPGSYGTIIVNGTLNVPDGDAEIVIYNTDPDSSLGGTGIINYGGSLTDDEGGIFAGCTTPCDGAALPVTLITFTGELYEGQQMVKLDWVTGSELHNEGFYIERSNDGQNWDELGFVEGNGTTSDIHVYSFLDYNISISSYYRLLQVDYDGQFEYSPWIYVSLIGADTKNVINIYPNPTRGAISFGGLVNELYDIEVMDMSGKIVLSLSNVSLSESESAINRAIESHSDGLFLFKFVNPGYAETLRLIKN